ncbi:unnamed protein product [Adineta steineri]|uniref:G-protein coupled receptors family 1 profile domain-containing protein n=1 Tax=Adineta steineri TaxID=433720 RepID=A0A814L9Y3_9BILA|nr:unnamed protein product [Adineta steineri]CAF1239528.1 unnamed protein product [Adineta steineri]CAF3522873.1 unnamed protein product [Adineta steineri]CAF4063327.1 unnamed protein product [Adineta steineri]CAF4101605.1 unnamed protein product [Adineta steineri]
MLIANTYVTILLSGSVELSMRIFALQNDLKQIIYEDRFCAFRGLANYVVFALFYYSFVLQALYRYVTTVYLTRLFWQSIRFQAVLIGLAWAFCLLFPLAFIFSTPITYNSDNQICQLSLQFSFAVVFTCTYLVAIPVTIIISIYYKLVRYVRRMNQNVAVANTLLRAQRELKMIERIVKLVMILVILTTPYVIFIIMSFFTTPPKYHFRIALLFVDVSLLLVTITICQFTDPIKASVIKRIKRRRNIAIVPIT